MANPHPFPHIYFDGDTVLVSSDLSPEGEVVVSVYEVEFSWSIEDSQDQLQDVDDVCVGRVIRPNVEAFQAALDQITNRPLTWNQGNWLTELPEEVMTDAAAAPECGTAGCLAGTVGLMAGFVPVADRRDQSFITPGGRRSVSLVSDEVLGLSGLYGANLYYAGNTLSDLWGKAQVLCGGALTVPDAETIEAAQQASWGLYGRATNW